MPSLLGCWAWLAGGVAIKIAFDIEDFICGRIETVILLD